MCRNELQAVLTQEHDTNNRDD